MTSFARPGIALCLLLLSSQSAQADWNDLFDNLKESVQQEIQAPGTSVLSEQTVASGLKQALNQGVHRAVKKLGTNNGFLKDPSVSIPMPDSLAKLDKGLRKIGREKYADRFVTTMNRAAEKAVPETTRILVDAIKSMSLNDAMAILNGENDAATQYFKRSSSHRIEAAIRPIVTRATDAVGVTASYKKMMSKAGFLSNYIDQDSLDIDQYITRKAVAGLFIKIGDEEKRIRENPVARTTELLRDVFGTGGN